MQHDDCNCQSLNSYLLLGIQSIRFCFQVVEMAVNPLFCINIISNSCVLAITVLLFKLVFLNWTIYLIIAFWYC